MFDPDITLILRLMGLKPNDIREWPPSSYEWFQLREFEGNPAVIEEAYQKLMARLQEVVSPRHPQYSEHEKDLARKLQSHSTIIRRILLTPHEKKIHDEALRQRRGLYKLAWPTHQTPKARPNDLWPPKKTQKHAAPKEPVSRPAAPKEPSADSVSEVLTTDSETPFIKVEKEATNSTLKEIKLRRAKKRRQELIVRLFFLLLGIVSAAALVYFLALRNR